MYAFGRQLHQSWLLACLFLGSTAGVIVSFWLGDPRFTSVSWPVVGIVLAVIGIWRRRAWCLPVLCIAGGLIGLWRGGNYRLEILPYSRLEGHIVTVQGRVSDDADSGEHGETIVRLSTIMINGHALPGSVWVSSTTKAEIWRGDSVAVKGKLATGFGSFAASMYRAELMKAERPEPGDVALRVRDWFAGGVRTAVPEPEASLGVGYLVGQRRSLPENLDAALKAAGLTHIVVASGYNLTILVGIARRLLARFSKFLATFLSGGMIISFVAITGMSPSMSRAGLVTGLSLLAWYYGRKFHPVVLLALAAAVTLCINPSYGGNDLGWQLSFASFAGVLIVGPLLQQYFFGDKPPGVVRQVLFETLSAWLCTVPLIILAFGQFSNVAIIANLLVLPFVPLAMLLTFVAGVAALIIPPLAGIAGFPAFLLLGYMTKTAMYLGSLPWAQTVMTMTPVTLGVYYVVLVAICGYIWHVTKFNFVGRTVTEEG